MLGKGLQIDDSFFYTLLSTGDPVIIAAVTDDASYVSRKLNSEYKNGVWQ